MADLSYLLACRIVRLRASGAWRPSIPPSAPSPNCSKRMPRARPIRSAESASNSAGDKAEKSTGITSIYRYPVRFTPKICRTDMPIWFLRENLERRCNVAGLVQINLRASFPERVSAITSLRRQLMCQREGWHSAPVRTMMCARSHTAVPPIGIADLFVGDRPRCTPVPRLGPREVRPKPHPKGSYSETITTSSPSISSAGTAP